METYLGLPIKSYVDPNIQFQPGNIAQKDYSEQYKQVATLCEDGINPAGIIDDIKYDIGGSIMDTTSSDGKIHIWNCRLVAKTDLFDTEVVYKEYDNLFCKNGLLTTEQVSEKSRRIGMVLKEPTADNRWLEFLYEPNE
jgi:hypothetical protein